MRHRRDASGTLVAECILFAWGHSHDFGPFQLEGAMLDRHLKVLAHFMEDLKELPTDLDGLRVLDIGCWTGGTCPALAALGAEVVGVEEVRMYAETVEYLAHAFGVDTISVLPCSLYELPDHDLDDSFDFVLYSGVLYHVTDPILSLRICFNCLKDGGKCLLESAARRSDESVVTYQGAEVFWAGTAEERNRRGWNWFVPSAEAARRMLGDVGFDDVRVLEPRSGRLIGCGTRTTHRDMLRAGLSRPDIR